MNGAADTTVALVGNVYFPGRIRQIRERRFLEVAELLRAADVCIANLECTIPDPDDPPAFAAGSGWATTYMAAEPAILEELRFLGVDALCLANNHVSDFGDAGILSTIAHLRRAQMPYAGIGASLTEATQAAYIDTPSGLRVALVAVCDWGPRGNYSLNSYWPQGYFPSDDAPPFVPRPGVNLLRYEVVSHVSREQLSVLRQISEELGWEEDKIFRSHGFYRSHPMVGMTTNLGVEVDSEDTFWFMGRKFVATDTRGHRTIPCADDLERNYKSIREAARQADIVCVALHDQSHGHHVLEYIDEFAHGAIDAGADVFFNNGGAHMGVEIYDGKAIVYGLPSFFLQTEAVRHVPSGSMSRYGLAADGTASDFIETRAAWAVRATTAAGGLSAGWKLMAGGSAVHTFSFDERARLQEIRVHPIEPLGGTNLNPDERADDAVRIPRFRMSMPLMAEPGSALAERVLEQTVESSRRFGTSVEITDDVAIIRV